jgi:hypothetical protein
MESTLEQRLDAFGDVVADEIVHRPSIQRNRLRIPCMMRCMEVFDRLCLPRCIDHCDMCVFLTTDLVTMEPRHVASACYYVAGKAKNTDDQKRRILTINKLSRKVDIIVEIILLHEEMIEINRLQRQAETSSTLAQILNIGDGGISGIVNSYG